MVRDVSVRHIWEHPDRAIEQLKEHRLPESASYLQKFTSFIKKKFTDAGHYSPENVREMLIQWVNTASLEEKNSSKAMEIAKIYDFLAKEKNPEGRSWVEGMNRNDVIPGLTAITQTRIEDPFTRPKQKKEAVAGDLGAPPQRKLDVDSHERVKIEYRDISQQKLFHFFADNFGKDSPEEGWDHSMTLPIVISALAERRDDPAFAGCLEELEKTLNVVNNIPHEDLRGYVKSELEAGRAVIVPGGWTGNPSGHALLYRFIPKKDGTFAFQIYNSGAGLDFHAERWVEGKHQYFPFSEWDNIPLSRLSDKKSNNFFKAIRECNPVSPDQKVGEYDEKAIYKGIVSLIVDANETPRKLNDLDKEWMSPQDSGLCATKSILAYLRVQLGRDKYKLWKCDTRLNMLSSFVKKSSDSPSVKTWALVNKSYQIQCGSLLSLQLQGIIGDRYITEASRELEEVERWLQKHKDKCLAERLPLQPEYNEIILDGPTQLMSKVVNEIVSLDKEIESLKQGDFASYNAIEKKLKKITEDLGGSYCPKDFVINQKRHLNVLENKAFQKWVGRSRGINPPELEEKQQKIISNQYGAVVARFDKLIKQNSPKNTMSHALELTHAAWQAHDDIALHQGLVSYITSLPIDSKYWNQTLNLTKSERERLTVEIGEIIKILILLSYSLAPEKGIWPEHQFCLSKLLHLQILIFQGEAGRSSSTGLCKERIDSEWILPPFTRCTDPKMFRYFDHNIQKQIAHMHRIEGHYAPTNNIIPRFNKVDLTFESYLRTIESIDRSPNSNLLTRAQEFASDGLPPYVKSLRDSCVLTMMRFEKWNKFYQSIRDRSVPFKVLYNVQQKGDGADIEISSPYEQREYLTDLEFKNNYRPFKHKFFQEWIERKKENEKEVLTIPHKTYDPNITVEHFREIAHITSSSELQALQLIEYFKKHPNLLQDTDFQQFMLLELFAGNALEEAFKTKKFKEQLREFIETADLTAKSENQIQIRVFLCQLKRYLMKWDPDSNVYTNALNDLKSILKTPHLSSEERVAIWQQVLAEYKERSSEELKEEDLLSILEGHFFLIENQPNPDWTSPTIEWEASTAVIKHAETIRKLATKNKSMITELGRRLWPEVFPRDLAVDWTIIEDEGAYPIFRDTNRNINLYILSGQIIHEGLQRPLPKEITGNRDFQRVFQTINKGIAAQEGWIVKDKNDQEYRLQIDQGDIKIQRHLEVPEPGWYEYVSPDKIVKSADNRFESALGSAAIVHQTLAWKPLKENLGKISVYEMYDPSSNERVYSTSIENSKLDIKRQKDGLFLGNPSPAFANEYKGFEIPAYVNSWYTERGELVEVELPRFNLIFRKNPKTGDFECNAFPGFRLDPETQIKSLKSYSHYLVIVDENGNRKVLSPKYNFLKPKEHDVLAPSYALDFDVDIHDMRPQSYVTIDVTSKGKLISKSREAQLHLATIYTLFQQYRKAGTLLRKWGEKLYTYTPKEEALLLGIANLSKINPDIYAPGQGLRAFAAYVLLKQEPPSSEKSSQLKDLLRTSFTNYVKHLKHARGFQFKLDEEVAILNELLRDKFDPFLYMRLEALNPKAAKAFSKQASEVKISTGVYGLNRLTPDADIGYNRGEKLTASFDINRMPITNSASKLRKHFLFVFEIARGQKGNPKNREHIRAASTFLLSSKEKKDRALGTFLLMVLSHPEEFQTRYPDPNQLSWTPGYGFEDWLHNNVEKSIQLAQRYMTDEGVVGPQKVEVDLREKKYSVSQEQTYRGLSIPAPDTEFVRSWKKEIQKAQLLVLDHVEKGHEDNEDINEWLTECIQHSEAAERAEWEMLLEDEKQLQKEISKTPHTVYHTDQENQLLEHLEQTPEFKDISKIENEIRDLANRLPDTLEERIEHKLKVGSGSRQKLKLEEIIMIYGRQQPGVLKQRNPALTEADIRQLYDLVSRYLQIQTKENQRVRALQAYERYQKAPLEQKEELFQAFAQEIMSERAYSLDNRWMPALMVFEYYAGISLRPVQVEMLKTCLEKGELNAPIIQLIMGSGKSKVLIPLLLLLMADGKRIPLLILPQALFESVAGDTQRILLDAFGQRLNSLVIDRNTALNADKLRDIYASLKNAKENQECLIMPSRSVQCLILKFIEQMQLHMEGPNCLKPFPEDIVLLSKILNILGKNSHSFIDEADSVFNILQEVCFSIGKPILLDLREGQILAQLCRHLYEDPEFREQIQIDSDPDKKLNAPAFTEEKYHQIIKPKLADIFLKNLNQFASEPKQWKDKLEAFHLRLQKNKNEYDLAYAYLTRDPDLLDDAQRFYDSLDPDLQNMLALSGEGICSLLPYTLSRISDMHYGLDPDGDPLSIPYKGANSPAKGSQFANRFITMLYTLQYYAYKGFTPEVLRRMLVELGDQAENERRQGIRIDETNAWKAFKTLCGPLDIPLYNFTDAQLQALSEYTNSSMDTKLKTVTDQILSYITLFDTTLTATAINLPEIMTSIWGCTGTLSNQGSFHSKLHAVPTPGTEAKTLNLLWKKGSVRALENLEIDATLREVVANPKVTLLADAGGYFYQDDNQGVARRLQDISNKPAVYYDDQGEQTILEGAQNTSLSNTKVPPEGRLTFLDQIHTTGADVPQPYDAVGVVTIGKHTTRRDLFQAVWRMRGLDKGQSIVLAYNKEVESLIRDKLKLRENDPIEMKEIIKFVQTNTLERKATEDVKSFHEQLRNLPQKLLLNILSDNRINIEAKTQAFAVLSAYWLTKAERDPRQLYGQLTTKQPSQKMVAQELNKTKVELENIFTRLPWLGDVGYNLNVFNEEAEKISLEMLPKLPPTVQLGSENHDRSIDIEKQQHKEREVELSVQKMDEKANVKLQKLRVNLKIEALDKFHPSTNKKKTSAFSLRSYMEGNPILDPYKDFFDGIYFTENMFEHMKSKSKTKNNYDLFGFYWLPVQYALLQKGYKTNWITAVTLNEAKQFMESPQLLNLTLGPLNQATLTPEQELWVMKMKFINGDSSYSEKEQALMKEWFQEIGKKLQPKASREGQFHAGANHMEKLFLHIIANRTESQKRYRNSILKTLFAGG